MFRTLLNETLKVNEDELAPAPMAPEANPELDQLPAPVESVPITDELVVSLATEVPGLADANPEEVKMGLETEQRYVGAVNGDLVPLAKIVLAKISEFPGKNYYQLLLDFETQLKEEELTPEAPLAPEEPLAPEAPLAPEPSLESVAEGKKEDEEKDADDKSAKSALKSILRKIHKAQSEAEVEDALDRLSKLAIDSDVTDSKVSMIQGEATRKKAKLAAGDKTEEPAAKTADKEAELGVAEVTEPAAK